MVDQAVGHRGGLGSTGAPNRTSKLPGLVQTAGVVSRTAGENVVSTASLRHNLFLRTQALATGRREDHLTEFIAAALAYSPRFAAAYVDLLIGRSRPDWGVLRLVGVETQVGYERNTPDMRLTLEDVSGRRRTVIVEHKIEAAETIQITSRGDAVVTESSELEESATERQLARYVKLPNIDGVLYFRESMRAIDSDVLANDRYIRPVRDHEQHFLWRDLRPLLEPANEDSPIVGWLREGFDAAGYVEPLGTIGDLNDADESTRDRNRRNFQALWRSTMAETRASGWPKVGSGSISELYIENHPSSDAEWVWVNPAHGSMFVIRVNLRDPARNDEFLQRCEAQVLPALRALLGKVEIRAEVVQVRRQEGPRSVIDVVAAQRAVVGEIEDVGVIEERLRGTVITVLRATLRR